MMNTRQMELLTQFAEFLEILQNPEVFKTHVEDAKKLVAEFKVMKEETRQIKSIDEFRASVNAELAKTRELVERDEKDLVAKQAKHQDDVAQRMKSIDEQEQKVVSERAKLVAQVAKFAYLTDLEAKLKAEAISLGQKQDTLNRKEQELNERISKVNAAMGVK